MRAQPAGADGMVLRDGPIRAQHLSLYFVARPSLQGAEYADVPHRGMSERGDLQEMPL
jgi:hypothetical protein